MELKTGGGRLFYETAGSGPDVVLLHPFPSDHRFWAPLAAQLMAAYRVTWYDLRWSGSSQPFEGGASMAEHAADLEALCRATGITKAVFAGVSIGGYILLEFWKRYRERARGLVLSDTRANADTVEVRAGRMKAIADVRDHGPEPFLQAQVARLLGESTRRNRPDVVEAALHTMRRSTVEGLAALQQGMAEREDHTPLLPSINVPALLLFGEEDVVTPPEVGRTMGGHIRGSSFVTVSHAGHYCAFERPQEAGRAMRQFLDRVHGG